MIPKPSEAAAIVFSDLPKDIGEYLMSMSEDQAASSFAAELTYPAYNFLPASYIITAHDKVLPATLQYEMVDMVEKVSGKTVPRHIIESGHAPHASQPENLAKIIVNDITSRV